MGEIGGREQIRALGHVDDDLQLRLVVVGQHLERDHFEGELATAPSIAAMIANSVIMPSGRDFMIGVMMCP